MKPSENDHKAIVDWLRDLFIKAKANPILYNCCTDNAEPDWAHFTYLTVGGCIDMDGFTNHCQSDDVAEFWCIYAYNSVGEAEPITDCKTRADASAIIRVLSLISKLEVR